ncbi:diguanylate cyclase [Mesorhizobium albiziae]|uniref:diguanylate cyclase n=1 Tax=Neomesorhizobium albiziae TaxID=335020 RepID=A0A1I3YNG4_9HYPH|nr:GGDEF domain-containing protein [Mesorhizobium albiziae]GLS33389.1 GGDEF domain-containing protein [Mesorhizobium albiziae]SFK33315.1 diguanylate cyclase [Mesorhizobium albiziae]
MQAASTVEERVTDIATTIAMTMRQTGVLGLPRNYEIFYEALTGANHALSLELVSLGNRPKQEDLDKIGRKYFAQHHGHGIVENAREIIARELEEIAAIMRNERIHLEKYGKILGETSDGLANRTVNKDLLQKIIGVMAVATKSTIDHGNQATASLGDKTAELETVKTKLEEYKKLADTDPLTHIWNRRAFDTRMAGIYNNNTRILFNALILADIDRFKEINDRYGHPVGDRILQIIAEILRENVSESAFVARTGGEEFALIIEGAGEEAIFELADRIRNAIHQTPFGNVQTGESYGPISISMGICMAADADGPDDLYAKADRAMYRSKVGGRNQVTKYAAPAKPSKNWLLYRPD